MLFSVSSLHKNLHLSAIGLILGVALLLLHSTICGQHHSMTVNGQERIFEVHLPSDFKENAPLLLALTGFTCDMHLMRDLSRFHEYADTMGIVVVYPDAPYPGWNTGATVEGYTFDTTRNDVEFISRLIDTMHAEYKIDLKRVFSSGWSGGGVMTFKLMGEIGHRLKAVASAGGGLHHGSYKYMNLQKSFPIMLIYGTDDFTCHWTDNTGNPYNGLPIQESIDVLREANGCTKDTVVLDLPDLVKDDSSTVRKISYTDCTGEGTFIVFKVFNGGHTWPGQTLEVREDYTERLNRDLDASAEIMRFFQQYLD